MNLFYASPYKVQNSVIAGRTVYAQHRDMIHISNRCNQNVVQASWEYKEGTVNL